MLRFTEDVRIRGKPFANRPRDSILVQSVRLEKRGLKQAEETFITASSQSQFENCRNFLKMAH